MDNLPTYNLDLSDDPALKTTTHNFEFKYCPEEQVERVIKAVQHNRLKKKKESIWSEFCSVSSSPKLAQKMKVTSDHIDFEDLKISSLSTVKLLSVEMESPTAKAEEQTDQPIIREMDQAEIRRVFEMALGDTFVKRTSAEVHIGPPPNNIKKNFSVEEILMEQGLCTPCREISPRWVSARPSPGKEASASPKTNKHYGEPVAVPSFFDIHQSSPKASNLDFDVDVETVSLKGNPSDERFIAEEILNLKVAAEPATQNSSQETVAAKSTVPGSAHGPSLSALEREELSKILQINEEISQDASFVKNNNNCGDEKSDNHEYEASEEEACHIFPTVHIRSSSPASHYSKGSDIEQIEAAEDKRSDPCDEQLAPSDANTPANTTKTNLSSARPPIQHENTFPVQPPRRKTKARRTPRLLSNVKEEELRAEEVAILSRITTYQNRIVRLLEKIRLDLYDVSEPEDHVDRKRRERRANEFVTRFARNNIYQVERMLEEVQLIPKEQYLSKNSNDFSIKVCNLYGTIYQAVATYHKQMPNFIVDHNPRKLQILLNCIVETTKTCIHKRIFSKEDIIVEVFGAFTAIYNIQAMKASDTNIYKPNLLEKCKNLTTFIQDIPLRVANAEVQKLRMSKKSEPKLDIFKQNKLSMYDTNTNIQGTQKKKKVVPARTNRTLTSGRMGRTSSTNFKAPSNKTEKIRTQQGNKSEIRISNLENVNTHIENIENGESQVLLTGLEQRQDAEIACKKGSSPEDINNTVIEALQSATKQRVQEILAPIMSNIGVLLNDQKATIDVQTLLSGLNTVTSQYANDAILAANQALNQQNNFNDKYVENEKNDINLQKRKNNLKCENTALPSTTFQQLTLPESKHHIKPSLDTTTTKMELNENFTTTVNQRVSSCIVAEKAPPTDDPKQKKSPNSPSIGVAQLEGLVALNSQSELNQRNLSTRGAVGEGGFGAIESSSSAKTNDMKKLVYQKNVQYTFIEANHSAEVYSNLAIDSRENEENVVKAECEIQTGNQEVMLPSKEALTKESKLSIKSVNEILNKRLEFMQNIFDNPLYVNEHFNEPWKVVSKIADDIISEAIINVEKNVDFGEENFVKDFIQSELQY